MLKAFKYSLAAVLLMVTANLLAVLFIGDYKKVEKIEPAKEEKNVPGKIEQKPEENTFKEDSTSVVESPSDLPIDTSKTPLDSSAKEEIQIGSEDYFQNLKNEYLGPILAELPEGRSREDVVVRYYTHNMDNKKVYALRSLGYYLHEKEPEDSQDLESNVLYYGKDVDARDIQLVAYTLVKNGVPLRAIKQSQFEWKGSALEIGTDSLLQDNPLLTIAKIKDFQL